MIRILAIASLSLLAACRQQSFDDRYKVAQQELDAKAQKIDQDLSSVESDAAAAGILSSEAATGASEVKGHDR